MYPRRATRLPFESALATVVAMGTRIRQVPAERRAEIAATGGTARAAALDADARAEIARSGAAKTNSPLNYAQRIRRAWQTMPVKERREVAGVLGGCNGLAALIAPDPDAPKKSTRRPSAARPSEAGS